METPKPGEKYMHFKGKPYIIIAIANDCETPEKKLVIYKQLYGSEDFPLGTVWSRPLENFLGDKEFEDGKKVKRFILITK